MSLIARVLFLAIALLASAGQLLAQESELLPDLDAVDEIPHELQVRPKAIETSTSILSDKGIKTDDETIPAGSVTEAIEKQNIELPVEGPPAPIKSTSSWIKPGLWYVEADAVFLERDFFNSKTLAIDATANSERELILSRSDPGLATSLKLTLGRNLFSDGENREYSTEFTFFGLGFYESTGSVQSASSNALYSDIDQFIGGFNGADRQEYTYKSDFDSYEWNGRVTKRLGRDRLVLQPDGTWVHEARGGHTLSVLAGFRYFEHDGTFDYSSVSTLPNLRRGDLNIHTTNDMAGFQVGGELTEQFVGWCVGIRGKAGVYLNWVESEQRLLAVDPILQNADRNSSDTTEAIAFLGEFSVFAKYNLRPDFALRIAYESMYLNSVALAPDQINFDPTSVYIARASGAEMYQGFSLGMEVFW